MTLLAIMMMIMMMTKSHFLKRCSLSERLKIELLLRFRPFVTARNKFYSRASFIFLCKYLFLERRFLCKRRRQVS